LGVYKTARNNRLLGIGSRKKGGHVGKEQRIQVEGQDFFSWPIHDHTKMKHQVLRCYLEKWFPILGSYRHVNYFDCFGGCGAYSENETLLPGSPILAAQAMALRGNSQNGMTLVVIEKDEEILNNLKKVFRHFCPSTNDPIYIQDDFDNSVNSLLDDLESNGKTLWPTFFFIDPFGLSIKYSTLRRVLSIDHSEIFLNFMYNEVTRFLGEDSMKRCLNDLFGCEDWQSIAPLSGSDREDSIIDLYRNQLKTFSQYVMPYRVSFPNANRTYYYLVHLTNHILGATIMKSCFAEVNQGRVEYLGKNKNQLSIFEASSFREEELKRYLTENYAGRSSSYKLLFSQLVDTTPYLEKEFKSAVKSLEKEQKAIVNRIESKRDGLKGLDEITFKG
jgi:three-Cys-motif partner protein